MNAETNYTMAYEEWLQNPYFDEATKKELERIQNQEKEIEDRFYKELEFGTAGLRGVLGAGTNRMNIYTVRKATQGLANYIRKEKKEQQGVAIAYDSRHMSQTFARETALCLAANGIKAYVFESLRPTPELSYAVRTLHCVAGVNITASHNPPEYNGYKVYWEDGAQITPPHDTGIMEEVRKITNYATARTMDYDEALAAGLYCVLGAEMDDAYIGELKKQVLHMDAITQEAKNLKIVYTPLHGTGNLPVRRILQELGFTNVYVVEEQALPDGDFPTVSYPNPEAEEVFTLGLALAKKVDADLVLATDPDADRLGVRVKDREGVYHTLTGNMSGCLLAEYELGQRKALGTLPENGYLIKSIVTSNMAKAIAHSYGIACWECLTGFKYIGQKMLEFERKHNGEYVFGFEESYGCLIGTYARDKDAIVASMALCEAAAYYRTKQMTLWDALLEAYEKYGYYREDVYAYTFQGVEGLQKMQDIMEVLRKEPPRQIGEYPVLRIRDYQSGIIYDVQRGETCQTDLPKSNVLYYELDQEAWVCVRPSGTEPKMKFYYGIRGETMDAAAQKSKELGKNVQKMCVKP